MGTTPKLSSAQAAAIFQAAFPPNPLRHIELTSFDEETRHKGTHYGEDKIDGLRLVEYLELEGQVGRLGYVSGTETHTAVGCIDIDAHMPKDVEQGSPAGLALIERAKADLTTLEAASKQLNLHHYVELSTSGTGYHVWFFLDKEITYEQMYQFLRGVQRNAGIRCEQFPSSDKGCEGKQVFLPYAGALNDEQGLGFTFLAEPDGTPVLLAELANLKRTSDARAKDIAEDERITMEEEAKAFDGEREEVSNLAPEAVEQLIEAAKYPPFGGFERHNSAMAFINVANRCGAVAEMVTALKSAKLRDAWGIESVRDWDDELDRLVDTLAKQDEHNTHRYGFTFLRDEQKFRIARLHRDPELVLAGTPADKVHEVDLASLLYVQLRRDVMQREAQTLAGGRIDPTLAKDWAYDPGSVTWFVYDTDCYVPAVGAGDELSVWAQKALSLMNRVATGNKLRKALDILRDLHLSKRIIELEAEQVRSGKLIIAFPGLHWDVNQRKAVPLSRDHVLVGRVVTPYDHTINPLETGTAKYLHNVFRGSGVDDDGVARADKYIETTGEYLGYAISPLFKERAILNFHGPSSTGKSTLAGILLAALGDASEDPAGLCYAMDGNAFSAQDWAVHLVGRRIAFIDEIDTSGSEGSKTITALKQIAGNSPVNVNPKGTKSANVKLGCKLVLNTNFELRQGKNVGNDSIFRRLMRLPFNNVVGRSDERGDFADYLKTEQGRKDAVAFVMWGLNRYLDNGKKFSHPELAEELIEDARDEANPMNLFVKEFCVVTGNEDDVASSKALWKFYERWADNENLLPPGGKVKSTWFYQEFASTLRARELWNQLAEVHRSGDRNVRVRFNNGKRVAGYKGLKLKPMSDEYTLEKFEELAGNI